MNVKRDRRAILFLNDNESIEPLVDVLARNGFEVFAAEELEAGLAEHRREPFQLAVVQEGYKSLSAPRVIRELLKIAWTTHSIIITDEDEDQLHEQAEGLGILGGVRDSRDTSKLGDLLATLNSILVWMEA